MSTPKTKDKFDKIINHYMARSAMERYEALGREIEFLLSLIPKEVDDGSGTDSQMYNKDFLKPEQK